MPDYRYRFRPVDRLLGKDGKESELDGCYIYFAPPEQLNDPLEGYKDVYFHGDKIIWRNLIKHYARCLTDSCISIGHDGGSQIRSKQINVFASARNSSIELNELNAIIFNKFISEPNIENYINRISLDRKVRRWELLAYLQALHANLLDVVFETFFKHGVIKQRFKYFDSGREQRLELIKALSSRIEAAPELIERHNQEFLKTHLSNSEKLLFSRYQTEGKGNGFFFLLFEFPEVFCREIESLMYPRWYTACFMSSCSDSSIWGSYGGNHKDVCLKFHTDQNQDITSINLLAPSGADMNGPTWSKTQFTFHDISYEKDFVEIDFFRSLGHLPIPVLSQTWFTGEDGKNSQCAEEIYTDQEAWRNSYWQNFYHSVTVKLKAWEREKESRLIQMSMLSDLSDSDLRKLRYDFSSLEGIIFGINTTMDAKLALMNRVRNLCVKYKRPELSFYQARYDELSREIVHDKLESIRVGYTETLN